MTKNKAELIDLYVRMGEVPEELLFKIEPKPEIDFSKVNYNSHYKSFDFWANKFPNGWQSIPFFENVIQNMADCALSPLEEMQKREAETKVKLEYLEYNSGE